MKMLKRKEKKKCFLILCAHVYADAFFFLGQRLTTGACVELKGLLIDSPGREQNKELQVSSVKVLGECDGVIYMLVSCRKTG